MFSFSKIITSYLGLFPNCINIQSTIPAVRVPNLKEPAPPCIQSIDSLPCLYLSQTTTCIAAHNGPHIVISGPITDINML